MRRDTNNDGHVHMAPRYFWIAESLLACALAFGSFMRLFGNANIAMIVAAAAGTVFLIPATHNMVETASPKVIAIRVITIAAILINNLSCVTLAWASLNPAQRQIAPPVTLAAISVIAVSAGKLLFSLVIAPIFKSVPTLIFGIFANEWWKKLRQRKGKSKRQG